VAYISNAITQFHFILAKEKDILKKARIWFKGGKWLEKNMDSREFKLFLI